MNIEIERQAQKFLSLVSDKDRRIIGEHIDRLVDAYNAKGIERLYCPEPRFRMHVSRRYTIFFYIHDDTVSVDEILTIEQAHKRYGRI